MFVCFAFMYALLSCLHTCILSSDIKRDIENRILFETFEKWHNLSSRYVSYIKSEASFIWRTGAWFLKPFEERVEENHIYHIVKPNSSVKTGTVYSGCNVGNQFFGGKNGKIDFNSKISNLNKNFQT